MLKIGKFWSRYDWPLHLPGGLFIAGTWLARAWYTPLARWRLAWAGAVVGRGFRVDGPIRARAERRGRIRLGEGVHFVSRRGANMVGLTGPVQLQSIGEGRIEIGDESGASSVVISARTLVRIGCRVKLGGNVRIYDHDYHALEADLRRGRQDGQQVRSKPVRIGDDVFVGVNAIILKGAVIGDRAVIGAGAVVAGTVPADEIWAGNPARAVKRMAAPEIGTAGTAS
jgi:acetyltransferase-like isoleucine patch superfamily enzyme